MTLRRKLAAILFSDIVGFTRHVSLDESQGLDWRARVEQLSKVCALTHSGRVVKTIGDAVMIEFSSAVEAVTCALAMQEEVRALSADLGLAEPLQVRIGIHVGDVVEEDEDLYGNAVNIAQRVQETAQPGTVCISREVYVQIRPILKLRCDPVTASSRKPMPEPVEVLQVTSEARERDALYLRATRIPAGFWGLAICAGTADWLGTQALSRLGLLGEIAGVSLLALVSYLLLRRLPNFVPELQASETFQKAGTFWRFVNIGLYLPAFLIVYLLLAMATLPAPDPSPTPLRPDYYHGYYTDPKEFETKYRGQEYKLANQVASLRAARPKIALERQGWGGGQFTFSGWRITLPFTLSGLFVLTWGLLTVNRQRNTWRPHLPVLNRAGVVRSLLLALTMMGCLVGPLYGLLFLGWMIRPFRQPQSIAWQSIGDFADVAADIREVRTRLSAWCRAHGYDSIDYCDYSLNTVPDEKTIGYASAYCVWRGTWKMTPEGKPEQEQAGQPVFSIACVASAMPAQTHVEVSAGGAVVGSREETWCHAEVNSLLAALKTAPASAHR
jgi:class 3 adenylate cyclase